MSEATTNPDDGRLEGISEPRLVSTILSSRFVVVTIVILALFAIFYAVPAIPWSFRRALSTNVGPVVFLSLAVAACWAPLSRPGSVGRMFWRILGTAFTFWLVVRAGLPYLKSDFPIAAGISADILYALYYLTTILAIELRPHLRDSVSFTNLERVVTWPVISLFVLGLLVYFVFVPLMVNPQQYATYVSSMYFFLALDLYIASRLIVMTIRVRGPGWRFAYGSLAVAMVGFACGDLLELLQYRGTIRYTLGTPLDLIWIAPFAFVVAAARLQPRLEGADSSERPDLFDPQQQLVVLALVLPVAHFLGYGLGIFKDEGHEIREIVTLCWLVLLGSMAFTQQTLLQRRSERLAAKSDEATRALQQSERMLRLMSDRQSAVEAQRQSEINFSRVFNASPDPMAIFTRHDRRLLEVNDSFERFWGGSRDHLLGRSVEELSLIHPRDLHTLAQTTADGRGVHDFPAHVRTSVSDVRQCLIGAEAIDFGGEPSLVVAIRDVTEQIELEAFRDTLIAQLESKNAELERFTYTVSHDLKSPLITIKGFLGFLNEDVRAGRTERLDEDLRRINDAADRMQRLLDELLELSRVGRIVNDPEPVPLRELIRESLELVRGRLEERHVRVEVRDEGEMPLVHGDRVRLLEVFQNLLENAAKFTGDQPQPVVLIRWKLTEGHQVRVSVIDNGIGIDPRFHRKVFGLFEQLQPSPSGTGIGLALVKRIVELHGGEIHVESEGEGRGSCFTFTLPLAPEMEVVP